MDDVAPPSNTGKEKRVIGVFVFMLGAGLFLETRLAWLGTLVMLCGAAVFLWGLIAARALNSVRRHTHVAATPSPEGQR
jgi:hypothetical protein